MAELFADVPEALRNAVEIARRCNLELKLGKSVLPAYPVPSGLSTEDFLRQQAVQGLEQRLVQLAALRLAGRVIPPEEYREPLHIERGVICQMGFAGYFLIFAADCQPDDSGTRGRAE